MSTGREAEEDKYYETALELVQRAGCLVRDAFNKPSQDVMTKASDTDLVTETDKAVEQLLFTELAKAFPDHRFIGEETASEMGKFEFSNAPTWIIDPIDGTTNFVHRCPHVSICVGLTINKEIRIGIVYNPILGDLFTARVGKGAYRNGFPIKSSGVTVLSKAVLVGSLGIHNIVHKPGVLEIYLDNLRQMLQQAVVATAVGNLRDENLVNSCVEGLKALIKHEVHGQRSFGSAALNMAYVAQGAVDAYCEYGIHCWDIAAATLIVREAGGCVIDPTGASLNLMRRRVLCASTEKLARELGAIMTHVEYEDEGTEI